jgi:hypothetical protein
LTSVTRLDYDTDFEPQRFEFEPPPGATREQDDSSSSSSGSIGLNPDGTPSDPPSGFLKLGLVPPGYRTRGVGQSDSSFDQEFVGPNDLELTVSQRKRALPDALKVGDEHELRGLTLYSTTLENGGGWRGGSGRHHLLGPRHASRVDAGSRGRWSSQ